MLQRFYCPGLVVRKRGSRRDIVIFSETINLQFKALRVKFYISAFTASLLVYRTFCPFIVRSPSHNTINMSQINEIISYMLERWR